VVEQLVVARAPGIGRWAVGEAAAIGRVRLGLRGGITGTPPKAETFTVLSTVTRRAPSA
jgi:hypothetical protein